MSASVRITASGTPSWSALRWRFEPVFPLSVGFGPVRSPPFWPASFAESSDALDQSISPTSLSRSSSTRRRRARCLLAASLQVARSVARAGGPAQLAHSISWGIISQGMPLFSTKTMAAKAPRSGTEATAASTTLEEHGICKVTGPTLRFIRNSFGIHSEFITACYCHEGGSTSSVERRISAGEESQLVRRDRPNVDFVLVT